MPRRTMNMVICFVKKSIQFYKHKSGQELIRHTHSITEFNFSGGVHKRRVDFSIHLGSHKIENDAPCNTFTQNRYLIALLHDKLKVHISDV
jgi:hypothetical protein